jgi:hypothetical protein
MTPWHERPSEVVNLLNPAFCSLVIRAFCSGYKTVSNTGPSIVLTPIVLPLALHGPTRNAMPATSRTKFASWLLESEVVRINLPVRIERLVPYTREAMIFGLHHGILGMENDIVDPQTIPIRGFSFQRETESATCIAMSERLGKLVASAGSAATIYSLLGIAP